MWHSGVSNIGGAMNVGLHSVEGVLHHLKIMKPEKAHELPKIEEIIHHHTDSKIKEYHKALKMKDIELKTE